MKINNTEFNLIKKLGVARVQREYTEKISRLEEMIENEFIDTERKSRLKFLWDTFQELRKQEIAFIENLNQARYIKFKQHLCLKENCEELVDEDYKIGYCPNLNKSIQFCINHQ